MVDSTLRTIQDTMFYPVRITDISYAFCCIRNSASILKLIYIRYDIVSFIYTLLRVRVRSLGQFREISEVLVMIDGRTTWVYFLL